MTEKQKERISIALHGTNYHVTSPYRKEAVQAWRNIPGRRFDHGINIIPLASAGALWAVLQRYYTGLPGDGPKGKFTVQEPGCKSNIVQNHIARGMKYVQLDCDAEMKRIEAEADYAQTVREEQAKQEAKAQMEDAPPQVMWSKKKINHGKRRWLLEAKLKSALAEGRNQLAKYWEQKLREHDAKYGAK